MLVMKVEDVVVRTYLAAHAAIVNSRPENNCFMLRRLDFDTSLSIPRFTTETLDDRRPSYIYYVQPFL